MLPDDLHGIKAAVDTATMAAKLSLKEEQAMQAAPDAAGEQETQPVDGAGPATAAGAPTAADAPMAAGAPTAAAPGALV
eukprot:1604143-Alexandrium_andersonii.AAC.1